MAERNKMVIGIERPGVTVSASSTTLLAPFTADDRSDTGVLRTWELKNPHDVDPS